MQCPQCKQTLWLKKEWFKPQWQANQPVVLGHPGGDFDRCKKCYNGLAVMPAAGPATQNSRLCDANARVLCAHMLGLALKVRVLERFMLHILSESSIRRTFKHMGGVTCLLESDPKQNLCRDGRYTFDPRNRNYQKVWWLAWPNVCDDWNQYNMTTLGDAIEAILGIWEAAVTHKHHLQQEVVVKSMCTVLSSFCHAVYHFTQYTDTEFMPRPEWLAYVTYVGLQVSVATSAFAV